MQCGLDLPGVFGGAVAIGCRVSIEHAELIGARRALDQVFLEAMEAKEQAPVALFLAIDSLSVVQWIGGVNLDMDVITHRKVKDVHSSIADLWALQISVHLVWVRGHSEEMLNEVADRLAKMGMYNTWQLRWSSRYRFVCGRPEWTNISEKAVRREGKRLMRAKQHQDWEVYKASAKIRISNARSGHGAPVLSLNLVVWDIGHHRMYKYERRALTWHGWSRLCAFRSGHVDLAAQKKFYRTDEKESDLCVQCDCNARETVEHFVFDCNAFAVQRRELLQSVRALYVRHQRRLNRAGPDWRGLDSNACLRFCLFPFQEERRGATDLSEDTLIKERLEVIEAFLAFTYACDRWTDKD